MTGVGPRKVGGIYRSGYSGDHYEVLHIGEGYAAEGGTSRINWSPWSITVRSVGGNAYGPERTHCTAWVDATTDRRTYMHDTVIDDAREPF